MTDKLQAIRGMNDITPAESIYWQEIEAVCRDVAKQYSYREIRFPILEQTQLFKRTIGDATDIIEKEMYTFDDRNGDSLSLRPEGTAGCVRAGIEQNLLHNQIQRLWYLGPMFRHERPQKGRLRQFHQFGVEVFGLRDSAIDVEIILLSKRILNRLSLGDVVTLEINTLGSFEEREAYQTTLVDYYRSHEHVLDEDSKRRLTTNPMRILDSKNPDMKAINDHAPTLMDFISGESKTHFDQVCELLTSEEIQFRVNPRLVRGLDYYCNTVFEWVTDHLGAQGTVCAGGRYDGLVEQLGGKATPAVGFAMGLERLVLLLQEKEKMSVAPDFYVVSDESVKVAALALCEQLRHHAPSITVEMDAMFGKFANQLKRAAKSGAEYALILGEKEAAENQVIMKNLKLTEQETVSIEELFAAIESEAER
ncbi:MAG TPA: histidine--tRNA ligase [Coxiellaceae bacterium]|nr:histidine--tRNA ligase [Coxiellaceae bacterium]